MVKELLVGLAVAAVAVFAIAWAASPVLAAQALIRAAKAGDADKIERLVDFPALRESLKAELSAELAAHMRRDPRIESDLGGLGLILAPMLLSGAVDAVVTPEVVAQMVTTAEAPDPTVRDQPEPGDATDEGDDIHQSWGYRDLNTFAVTLTDRDHPDQRLALIMERRGLFTWKLAAVDIQNDARG